MALWRETALGADAIANRCEFGHIDDSDLSGIDMNEEVLWALAVGELVVTLVGIIDEDLGDDACVLEQVNRAVDRGFGDAVALAPHLGEQVIGFEKSIHAEEDVKDSGALGGVLLAK